MIMAGLIRSRTLGQAWEISWQVSTLKVGSGDPAALSASGLYYTIGLQTLKLGAKSMKKMPSGEALVFSLGVAALDGFSDNKR